jgi:hypothetical protein
MSERFDITYLLFLDRFLVNDDRIQWNMIPTSTYFVRNGSMYLTALGNEETFAITPGALTWDQYTLAVQFSGRSNGVNSDFGVTFHRATAFSYYAFFINTRAQLGTLVRAEGGVEEPISIVDFRDIDFVIHPDVSYTLRISIVREGENNRILVVIDGYTLANVLDNGIASGTIGLIHDAGATMVVDEVEVGRWPSAYDTLDLNEVG